MYDETDSIVDGLEELMKISDKKIVSQEGMICLGLIVLAGVFFNCPGTGDVEIWNSWMDYAGGYNRGVYSPDQYVSAPCPFCSDMFEKNLPNIIEF